jgi:hypothetical protein
MLFRLLCSVTELRTPPLRREDLSLGKQALLLPALHSGKAEQGSPCYKQSPVIKQRGHCRRDEVATPGYAF